LHLKVNDSPRNEQSTKKTPRGSTAKHNHPSAANLQTAPQHQRPALDERVTGLLLDSLASVQAALASAATGAPYTNMRKAVAFAEDEKREVTSAALAVAAEHPLFFSQHKEVLEFAVVWAAMYAVRVDHLFALSDVQPETGARNERACTGREAVFFALVILAPLLIFILFQALQFRRRDV